MGTSEDGGLLRRTCPSLSQHLPAPAGRQCRRGPTAVAPACIGQDELSANVRAAAMSRRFSPSEPHKGLQRPQKSHRKPTPRSPCNPSPPPPPFPPRAAFPLP